MRSRIACLLKKVILGDYWLKYKDGQLKSFMDLKTKGLGKTKLPFSYFVNSKNIFLQVLFWGEKRMLLGKTVNSLRISIITEPGKEPHMW